MIINNILMVIIIIIIIVIVMVMVLVIIMVLIIILIIINPLVLKPGDKKFPLVTSRHNGAY